MTTLDFTARFVECVDESIAYVARYNLQKSVELVDRIELLISNIRLFPESYRSRDYLPEFLRKSAESLSGKPVPPARIWTGIAIVIVTGFLAGSLLYAGVRNALISIGRNPLGKKGIIRGLMQVVIISLIIFITGLFGVYLLVKL